jgi:glycogen debranching enzyme
MKNLEYRLPVDALYTGSSLGNLSAFARLSATTELLGLWNSSDNQYYAGQWSIQLLADGMPLRPVDTRFGSVDQCTLFVSASIEVEQSFCLPLLPDRVADPVSQRIALFLLTSRNNGLGSVHLSMRHRLIFPGVGTDRFTKQPPADQCAKHVQVQVHGDYCTVITVGCPHEARVFGSAIPWNSFSADATSLDAEYLVELHGGELREICFALAFSPDGIEEALKGFRTASRGVDIRQRASEAMDDVLSRSYVFTPDPLINRALQWAKVNMIRVRHNYWAGQSFTNDPPQDIVVIRDLGWFVLGSDYLLPEFSRRMLEGALRYAVHDGGKLTEYFHAGETVPVRHDYHLNINDDTPLFVWALVHHALVAGDRGFVSRHWSAIEGACNWILVQIRDGLVRCAAEGTNVWGICGWRNIIDDYTLSGAVTEINAECYLALQRASDVARFLGRAEAQQRFAAAADTLRGEINNRLRSDRTGLYLLNLGNDGSAHHDITGDQIFPVLTGVADEEMSRNILLRLTQPDFWTDYGARTVAPQEARFDPDACYQLLGGVWPNLTAWIAYCLRLSNPEKVAEAMVNIYRIAEVSRPLDWGYVVPGEFPERLHGTEFKSRGMTLSPWTPPTYLWLGIEGLLGVRCSWEDVEFNPAIPPGWGWIAVKDLQVNGTAITAFLFEGIVYASHELKSLRQVKVGIPLQTHATDPRLFSAGLHVDHEILLFAAADESLEAFTTIEYNGNRQEHRITLSGGEAVLIRMPDDGGRSMSESR